MCRGIKRDWGRVADDPGPWVVENPIPLFGCSALLVRKCSWVGSQKTLAVFFLGGLKGFGLFLDRTSVWCVLRCYVWLYGVLCDPTCVRHCGLANVVG